MLNLKKKLTMMEPPKSITDQFPIPYPQVTATLPDNPSSAGHEFNLVRIVQEHGPKRLEQIDKDMKRYQDKIDALVREREQIQALVLAIK